MQNQINESFVLFRTPNNTVIQEIIGSCVRFEETKSTRIFHISPFHNKSNSYCIPYESINTYKSGNNYHFHFSNHQYQNLGKNHYKGLVERAIAEIKGKHLNKVVLANSLSKETTNFDPINFFLKVEKTYPEAFVYLISTPLTGTWIGASPEPLLIENNNNYSTIAMAGTKKANENSIWGQKEIEEQFLVKEYVLEKIGEVGIKTPIEKNINFKIGNLIHLRSEYNFEASKNQIIQLKEILHPTPAVAGLPKEVAIQFIKEQEGFSRNLYSGYLGIENNSTINLYVNLRCLELQNNTITFFAGAGITKDSNPEMEWEETQIKMKTLISLLD